jgi:hypothetical protein
MARVYHPASFPARGEGAAAGCQLTTNVCSTNLGQECLVTDRRPRHPNKEIEAALVYAEAHGWRVVLLRG